MTSASVAVCFSPAGTIPADEPAAPEIERFVVDQVRSIGRDSTLLAETLKEVRTAGQARIKELEAEQRGLKRDFKRHSAELRELAGRLATNGTATDRMADLQDRIRAAKQRATQVREELIALGRQVVDEKEVAKALALFDPVWETLSPREQVRIVRLLVQRVEYDGEESTVSVTFHPAGIKTLAEELEEADA